jgi:hypothetical protein
MKLTITHYDDILKQNKLKTLITPIPFATHLREFREKCSSLAEIYSLSLQSALCILIHCFNKSNDEISARLDHSLDNKHKREGLQHLL